MNELEMTITAEQLPVVQFNFDEVKARLLSITGQYSSLIVTDDNLSLCKEKQKELAGLRRKIDEYRKEIKAKMSEPIVAFENKCKELVSLVEKAEKPLKDGIQIYDDAKREEKRQTALKIISESVAAHGLTEKYASQVTVIDKYMNLTAKVSDVKEDVEQRVFLLLSEQNKEQEMLEIIQDTIDNENKTIKTPLSMSQFQRMIDYNMPTKDILNEIKKRAEQIREAEKPKPVEAPPEPPPAEPVKAEPESTEAPEMWFAELRFVETKARILQLRCLLQANGYNYKALNQGKIE